MRYVLAVKHGVYGSQGAYLAYQVAQALLAQGHRIEQSFVFKDGVSNGKQRNDPASDKLDLVEAWRSLAQPH
ncbi:DsrE family protein, partial [Glaesserella parasuis]|nr:DsrE family protein [Glaesserella parasuis]